MSNDDFAYTEFLQLPEARKLLAAIEKPGKDASWKEWSGEGGYDTEVKYDSLTHEELTRIVLPEVCSSISITASERLMTAYGMADFIPMMGEDWLPPDYGDDYRLIVRLYIDELVAPISLSYSKESGMHFFERPFNRSQELSIQFGKSLLRRFPEELLANPPDTKVFHEFVVKLLDDFSIPTKKSKKVLEAHTFDGPCIRLKFAMDDNQSIYHRFMAMTRFLLKSSSLDYFFTLETARLGETTSFEGKPVNTTKDANELLRRVVETAAYPSYDLRYSKVGPEDWKTREKRRKKAKEPVHQTLGYLKLENGTSAEVTLRYDRDGYVFTLNFDDQMGLPLFPQTKLFTKTTWKSGAE
jgi:hypothetical protein